MIKRALLSVYDKTGIVELAERLHELGIEIVSSGGTFRRIQDAGIPVRSVESVTQSPEMLDGRVKTLHPAIHGGILARRDLPAHMTTLAEQQIEPIDMVVGNLYPFSATIAQPDVTMELAIENIDIGGPSMLRSSAKNFRDVIVLCDPADYQEVIAALQQEGDLSYEQRLALSAKAFGHTAHYDSLISNYLSNVKFPTEITFGGEKHAELRYGENGHQRAAVYRTGAKGPSILGAIQLQGKAMSYNNYNDADAALRMILEFDQPAAIAVKHTNPCGAAVAEDILTAYKMAHDADPVSIFGGIVALNRPVDQALAKEMRKIFLDIIIAPGYSDEALEIFKKKKNMRVLEIPNMREGSAHHLEVRTILGGYLVQETDAIPIADEKWKVVTIEQPSAQEQADLEFAWKLIKHVKSNSIVVVKNGQTLGVGCGQVNRIDAARYALNRGGEACQGAVLASDGLFPFSDVVEEAAQYGISTIIQPGGSIRDEDSTNAANQRGMAMIHTGIRHFKH